jgi:peptide/nickel transport system ATP-binding protein
VALVGESGSGKSVAALAALGLIHEPGRQTAGSVIVAGKELSSADATDLAATRGGEIGLVFQEPGGALNPVLTVEQQLVETIRAHDAAPPREARDAAARLLDEVAVTNGDRVLRAYPHQLSGGQLQRVMIALALAGRPRLLIADEPTTALDLQTQGRILELLRSITEDGMGLLMITHDLAVVAGLVQRVVVMFGGRVIEEAPTVELFERPLHPYTRLLLAAGRRDAGSPRSDAGSAGFDGCRFASRCELVQAGCRAEEPRLLAVGQHRTLRCSVVRGDIFAVENGPDG